MSKNCRQKDLINNSSLDSIIVLYYIIVYHKYCLYINFIFKCLFLYYYVCLYFITKMFIRVRSHSINIIHLIGYAKSLLNLMQNTDFILL